MLMRMMTFNGNTLTEGMGIEQMTRYMKQAAKDKPGATLNDLEQNVIISWPSRIGPGTATIERPGQSDEVIQVKPSKAKAALVSVPAGVVARLAPKSPDFTGARFISSPNAEVFKQEVGAEGPAPALDAPYPANSSELDKAYINWMSTGEVGSSSKTLARALYRAQAPGSISDEEGQSRSSHPYDWDDFGRCIKMLDAVPQLRKSLDIMPSISPTWSLIHESFDRLEAIYRENATDMPSFREAVSEGLPSPEDRIRDLGLKALDLDEARSMDNYDRGTRAKAIEAELQSQIDLHRAAQEFAPHRPRASRKASGP